MCCDVLSCCVVLCCVVLYCVVLCCVVLCCTVHTRLTNHMTLPPVDHFFAMLHFHIIWLYAICFFRVTPAIICEHACVCVCVSTRETYVCMCVRVVPT